MSESDGFYRLSEDQRERILSGEASGERAEIDLTPEVCAVAECYREPAYLVDHEGRPEAETAACESHYQEAQATVGAEVLREL